MSKRILVVEDDHTMAMLLQDNLRYEGFRVDWAESADHALAQTRENVPDLVLLDVMLPNGLEGLELCRVLSQRMPVVLLTARGDRQERVRGLTLGADDYIVKPFALDELLARVKAVLRRTSPRLERLTLGDTVIDFNGLCAFKGNEELNLSEREFQILRHLAERPGEVVSRDELLRLVWGYSHTPPLTRTVDGFMARLRSKIEKDPHHPRYIRTAYGSGYRLHIR